MTEVPKRPTIGPDHPVETTDVTLTRPQGLNWDAVTKAINPIMLILIACLMLWNVLETRQAALDAARAAKAAAETRALMVPR